MDILYGNFLGKEDSWNNKNKSLTFFSKEKILKYFTDFEIIYYAEKKFFKDTIIEKNKYFHIFEIYAKKK